MAGEVRPESTTGIRHTATGGGCRFTLRCASVRPRRGRPTARRDIRDLYGDPLWGVDTDFRFALPDTEQEDLDIADLDPDRSAYVLDQHSRSPSTASGAPQICVFLGLRHPGELDLSYHATGAVDRLRALARPLEDGVAGPALVLAAADPANPYGAALAWPSRPESQARGHLPGRKAGALVVLVEGRLVLYVERGGRTLLSWSTEPALLEPAAVALAAAVHAGALGKLTVERVDGESVLGSDQPLAHALASAGFGLTPRGLRLRR